LRQSTTTTVVLAFATVFSIGKLASAQVSARELQSISTPGSVETPIGTLKFLGGVPTDDTVKKVFDNLDRMRGVQVFLNTLGGSSMYRLRARGEKIGAYFDRRAAVGFEEPLRKGKHLHALRASVPRYRDR
jgi:hypothetical protein